MQVHAAVVRTLSITVAMSVCIGAQAPLRPSPGAVPKIQEVTDKEALKFATDVADRARTTTGYLNADANQAIRRWDWAVRLWKKEKGSGAAPLLAEGVLLDCLSRLHGVVTRLVSDEKAFPFFGDMAAQRPGRAAKAFEAALKIDPQLLEARMRMARIRAPASKDAELELERIVDDRAAFPLSYLAAISRAETARAKGALSDAAHWYQRSLELNPRSTAATIGLESVKGGGRVPFDRLGSPDIYYSYPCTVLTPEVDAALGTREQAVVFK